METFDRSIMAPLWRKKAFRGGVTEDPSASGLRSK